MSVLLICDAPGCMKTTPAVVKLNRAAAPDGWRMQATATGILVVACCDDHLNIATKGDRR